MRSDRVVLFANDRIMALDFAMTANQLGKLCRRNEPLRRRRKEGFGGSDILDMDEYLRSFQWPLASRFEAASRRRRIPSGGDEGQRASHHEQHHSGQCLHGRRKLLSSSPVDCLSLSNFSPLSSITNGWRCFLLSSRAPRPSK